MFLLKFLDSNIGQNANNDQRMVECWLSLTAVSSLNPAGRRIFHSIKRVPYHTIFHYQPATVSLWPEHYWKGCELQLHTSVQDLLLLKHKFNQSLHKHKDNALLQWKYRQNNRQFKLPLEN